jgi:hypothetical protein
MAKKKAKKKVSKKAKKKTKKTKKKQAVWSFDQEAAVERGLKMQIMRKIMQVWEAVPGFENMVDKAEGSEGLQFGYTKCAEVFKAYGEECRRVGLHWRPVKKALTVTTRQVFCNATYQLTDTDTGYSITFAGMGQGNNGVWAVNSAQTVALKQALLELFGAYWEEAEDAKREEVNYWDRQGTPQTAGEVIEAMRQFFGEYDVAKAKQDAKNRKK